MVRRGRPPFSRPPGELLRKRSGRRDPSHRRAGQACIPQMTSLVAATMSRRGALARQRRDGSDHQPVWIELSQRLVAERAQGVVQFQPGNAAK